MYKYCSEHISNISFVFISKSELSITRTFLIPRFELAHTVTGTRSFHHFNPLSTTIIATKRVSIDSQYDLVFDLTNKEVFSILSLISINCCVWDNHWIIGFVEEIDHQHGEINASSWNLILMLPHGNIHIIGLKRKTIHSNFVCFGNAFHSHWEAVSI